MRLPLGQAHFFFLPPTEFLFPGDPALFVNGFHAAPVAKLLEFDLPLHRLLVFADIIITPLANSAAQRDQFVRSFNFSHKGYISISRPKRQPARGPAPARCSGPLRPG